MRVALMAVILALLATAARAEVQVEDALGRKVVLAKPASRVVSLAPGLFESGMSAGMPEKVSEGIVNSLLFPRRMGKADEFAALVRHVIENAYLNALTLDIQCGVR